MKWLLINGRLNSREYIRGTGNTLFTDQRTSIPLTRPHDERKDQSGVIMRSMNVAVDGTGKLVSIDIKQLFKFKP